GALARAAIHLGRNHQPVAPVCSSILQPPTQHLLGFRFHIHIGRVEKVDPLIHRVIHDRTAGMLIRAAPEIHLPQAYAGNLNPRPAEVAVFHLTPPGSPATFEMRCSSPPVTAAESAPT